MVKYNHYGKEVICVVTTIIIIAVIIVIVILLLSIITTNKAYQYKHTIDPIEDNPHVADVHNQQKDQQNE